MKNSPAPVAEIAADSFDAYVPAPMMGESPTRPYCLLLMPPVDVPAARLPSLSSATQPTVPNLCSSDSLRLVCGSPVFCSCSSSFCSDFQRRSVQKYDGSTISSP